METKLDREVPDPSLDGSVPAGDAELSAQASASGDVARHNMYAALGQIVLALSKVPRYRHSTLAELELLVVEPLLRNRIAVASLPAAKDGKGKTVGLAGLAIWASVSDEADARIREQASSGVFPVRLRAEDWASGDKIWVLDVIAPTRAIASTVLANLRKVTRQDDFSIYPVAAQQVDPAMLIGMKKSAGPLAQ